MSGKGLSRWYGQKPLAGQMRKAALGGLVSIYYQYSKLGVIHRQIFSNYISFDCNELQDLRRFKGLTRIWECEGQRQKQIPCRNDKQRKATATAKDRSRFPAGMTNKESTNKKGKGKSDGAGRNCEFADTVIN